MTARKPIQVQDEAGLDKLLLAAGKGVARFLEGAAQQRFRVPLNLWDGPDGLGAVLDEHLKAAGVPNKRLPELLTPRAVIDVFDLATGAEINRATGRKFKRRRKVTR